MLDSPPARTFRQALYEAGIPQTAFATDDLQQEYARLKELGVEFKSAPREPAGEWPATAVLDDTCGNWIQLFQA